VKTLAHQTAVAQGDPDARQELAHAEGLGEIVVGPGVEGLDLFRLA
jgi:hypothetical protein